MQDVELRFFSIHGEETAELLNLKGHR